MMWRSIILCFIGVLYGSAVAAADNQSFRATIYSDGASCPGSCDAHVVFDNSHNGTIFAFAPSSSRTNPVKCRNGQLCQICFDASDTSCLTVRYRGGGPDRWTFDFTPAFYTENCRRTDIPAKLTVECDRLATAYAKLTQGKIYCIEHPDVPQCVTMMEAARARKAADLPDWLACRANEQDFNNKMKLQPHRQRSNACAYEAHGTGGPNSRGTRWKRLLPAACLANSYVGRDGLDCCGPDPFTLGGLGRECAIYLTRG